MLKILIASHGNYAAGIKSAADIIVGEKSHVSYISAYVDDIPLKDKFEKYFADVTAEDQVIVLTDLFAGSVNQTVTSYLLKQNVYIISGINLAVVLEIVLLNPESEVTADRLRYIVEESKKQIVFINDSFTNADNKDDFDF